LGIGEIHAYRFAPASPKINNSIAPLALM